MTESETITLRIEAAQADVEKAKATLASATRTLRAYKQIVKSLLQAQEAESTYQASK